MARAETARVDRWHWFASVICWHGYRPSIVFETIRRETEFLTPLEAEERMAQRLQLVMDDTVAHDQNNESITGDSQVRPGALYPDQKE